MIDKLNRFGKNREPFLFVADFDKNIYVYDLKNLDDDIYYKIDKQKNYINKKIEKKILMFSEFITYEEYKQKFLLLQNEISLGNTYLANLCVKTKIDLNIDLLNLFFASRSKFKLFFKDKFCCFSPERFIQINKNKIYTFPMKGTIDASIPDAKNKILNDPKELAEHTMVVDLLRNDLGIIAKKICVEKFRYLDLIAAGEKKLYQVSSKISGELDNSWNENIGEILLKLLPAGSITGTPKKRSVEILKNIESFDRGFFTGVFGIFDGYSFDSAVSIRFIENNKDGLFFKSGGGITCDSDPLIEYEEIKNKTYVPVF